MGAAPGIVGMTPQGRRIARMVGILLLTAGATLLALGFAAFLRFGAAAETGNPPSLAPIAVYLILGALLIIAGVFLLRMGFLRLPADTRGAGARRGPGTGAPRDETVDEAVEAEPSWCPTCGHPEREGAAHCSECGARL